MNVLITGGTGMIGRAIARQLLAAGHQVTVLSRNANPYGLPEGILAVQWDGRTPNGWGHLVDTADAVINLAGENIGARRWTSKRKAELLRSRQDSAAAVAAAIQAAAPRKRVVVQPSGVGIYGTSVERTFTEEDQPGDDYLARLAVAWEQAIQPAVAGNTRLVTVRMGIVLSREDGVLPRLELPARLFVAGPLGGGRQWYSWIHLADVAGAIRCLLESPDAEGIYNLVTPQPLRQSEVSRRLAKRLRRPYWAPLPGFILWLVLGEMSMLVLKGQRVLPERLLQAGYIFQFPDFDQALADLYPRP